MSTRYGERVMVEGVIVITQFVVYTIWDQMGESFPICRELVLNKTDHVVSVTRVASGFWGEGVRRSGRFWGEEEFVNKGGGEGVRGRVSIREEAEFEFRVTLDKGVYKPLLPIRNYCTEESYSC